MTRLLEVGRIGRAHGLRGEVVVSLTTDRVERLAAGSVLDTAKGALEVVASRPYKNGHIVQFGGVGDRDSAEALCGTMLLAEPLDDPDALWVHELIGSTVALVSGEEVGVVVAVEANPASDLLVLDTGDLVPLTFAVLRADSTIVIDPPRGLLHLDEG